MNKVTTLSLEYPPSVFNKNATLKYARNKENKTSAPKEGVLKVRRVYSPQTSSHVFNVYIHTLTNTHIRVPCSDDISGKGRPFTSLSLCLSMIPWFLFGNFKGSLVVMISKGANVPSISFDIYTHTHAQTHTVECPVVTISADRGANVSLLVDTA